MGMRVNVSELRSQLSSEQERRRLAESKAESAVDELRLQKELLGNSLVDAVQAATKMGANSSNGALNSEGSPCSDGIQQLSL